LKLPFYKYQGAGNDFVLIDQRHRHYLKRADQATIEKLCDRRFGIGADGLMLLQKHPKYDFEMIYFNADGRESSMCGNGGRCITAFAHHLGMIGDKCQFLAIDGEHAAIVKDNGDWIELQMIDVPKVEKGEGFYVLNTGSPHFVQFVPQIEGLKVFEEGRKVRYSERFAKEGINVNFTVALSQSIEVATYERGVEDETLACGTGVTAAAIAYYLENPSKTRTIVPIQAKGGKMEVRFEPNERGGFENIWLCGPAKRVFAGTI
jgi:diaminopimelate epimerase